MTKSELVERIANKQSLLAMRDVDLAVKTMLEHMTACLAAGGRIEIRGFGSFSLHHRRGRVGRKPKTQRTARSVVNTTSCRRSVSCRSRRWSPGTSWRCTRACAKSPR